MDAGPTSRAWAIRTSIRRASGGRVVRRTPSLTLALLGLLVSSALAGYTAWCGQRIAPATEEGQEGGSSCVGRIHPATLLMMAGSGATLAGAWWGKRALAWAAAGAVLLVGLAFGLSLGWWGIGVAGILLAAAAFATPRARP